MQLHFLSTTTYLDSREKKNSVTEVGKEEVEEEEQEEDSMDNNQLERDKEEVTIKT